MKIYPKGVIFLKQNGILIPVFSLPSPYGIGTLGKGAYDFVRFLKKSEINIWQVLPVGPTGYGDSPYQSFSSFAGNPYFIDPDTLVTEGILRRKDLPERVPQSENIDYGRIYLTRGKMLRAAFSYSYGKIKDEVGAFAKANPDIYNYAFYMAIKDKSGGVSWRDFPAGLKMRRRAALEKYEKKLGDGINYHLFVQYLFFRQWKKLREYTNSLGIKILGDMPIYVAPDSSDAWADYRSLQYDKNRRPTLVAGVPPDYFSADGQKWGNPLYNWTYIKSHRYDFWIRRMRAAGGLFDIVRLDHFIGFANYYSVPADAPTAREGFWRDGPGYGLFRAVKNNVPGISLIAEDLGVVSEKVKKLVKKTGFPSMRVLQFAFGGDDENMHLPQNIGKNILVYTGTHDNAPTLGWWNGLDENTKRDVSRRLGKKNPKMPDDLIRAALGTKAETVIIPMWDVLGLGDEARVNTPGLPSGNWSWRIGKIPKKAHPLPRKS